MEHKDKIETTISCLQHAIEDAQDTIRAYDSKAEILGILLTVAIGITNFTFLQHSTSYSKALLVASWIAGLVAICALGLVLHPKKDLFKKIDFGGYTPKETYFLSNIESSPQNTVTELASKALNTDWVCELTYENMKLSLIREYKHCCFVFALKAAGITLLLIALTVAVGSL